MSRLLLGVFLLLSGCSYTSNTLTPNKRNAMLQDLHNFYYDWKGTPYQYGGTSREGIDCSAFVFQAIKDTFRRKMPRTTKEQLKMGNYVSKSTLRVGDVVFFKTGRNSRHVGIYLEDGRFLHVSTSKGVMISNLEQGYWRDHYWTARRVKLF